MARCSDDIVTISYGGLVETAKRWKCPSSSTARYVYLLYVNLASSPKLGAVEVYTPTTAFVSVEGSKYDKCHKLSSFWK